MKEGDPSGVGCGAGGWDWYVAAAAAVVVRVAVAGVVGGRVRAGEPHVNAHRARIADAKAYAYVNAN
jgi:anti-sigma-K factor RskA